MEDRRQSTTPPAAPAPATSGGGAGKAYIQSIQPILVIVVSIFAVMFILTFSLLLYAKLRHAAAAAAVFFLGADIDTADTDTEAGLVFSGVHKAVVESLPFFRFSDSGRGGLECSVCLSGFEPADLLRLLPKCQHAFHIECIDKWLENHSSCPLCRVKVSVDDLVLPQQSNSSTFSRSTSVIAAVAPSQDGTAAAELQMFSEWAPDRATVRSESYDGFKHHRIVSAAVATTIKDRWSDIGLADMVALMEDHTLVDGLSSANDRRPPIGTSSLNIRSMSDAAGMQRFGTGDMTMLAPDVDTPEEKLGRRIWLRLVRRTVQAFGGAGRSAADAGAVHGARAL